ncbi:hypothetical protein F5Y12DRAFT_717751 [Xylaria sp. FL1777]|nr:hypothetical protein F5Y12DRAFT_717751 [Xylaria sp. FL1777]
MYPSKLAFLAFACKAILAFPTPATDTASLPLPARTIFQLDDSPPKSWFENIALRRNGDLLVTMLSPNASIYSIQEPLSGSPKASIINIANATGLLGITETAPDVFAVAGGLFGTGIAVPVPGSMGIWEVDFRGPEPTTRLVTKIAEAGILNGVASVPSCPSSAILVADNELSLIWRVDLKTGEYETAAEVPEMKGLSNATVPLGVNGVKTRGEYLYFSNSNLASIFRLPIDKRGVAAKDAKAERVAKLDTGFVDDFVIDEEGKYWGATNSGNTVVVAKRGSGSIVVAGKSTELTVAGDTALGLGRTEADKNIVYVVTGGTVTSPVNGTVSESAKVVAIDRTGFE